MDADKVIVMDQEKSSCRNAAGSVLPGGKTQGVQTGCAAGDDFSGSAAPVGINVPVGVLHRQELVDAILRVAQIGE